MNLDTYLENFLNELRELGITTKGDPQSVNAYKKMAALYRNAGYMPNEAAILELAEYTQRQATK